MPRVPCCALVRRVTAPFTAVVVVFALLTSSGCTKPAMGKVEMAKDKAAARGDGAIPAARDAVAQQNVRAPAPGRLTAGSFDDTQNPDVFRSFLRKIGQSNALVGRLDGRQLVITVVNDDGVPVQNARVRVSSAEGREIELISRTDGRVVVVAAWDRLPAAASWTIQVTPPDGGAPIVREIDAQLRTCVIPVGKMPSLLPDALDLALAIDCTGSMGDELAYLKSEMSWVAKTIKARFPQVKQRFALVCYRDVSDEYVTRTFPFTDSLDEVQRNLNAQSAGGGGDYPEAVHKAMEQASQLHWNTGRTARVLIHIGDAPPHAVDLASTLDHVNRLRKQGVAIYPIACSGYDPTCEFVMRTSALLTGGQFVFLTDDSGVGEAHAEPNINAYHVERQNALLVRLIASELSGRRIEPQADEILRTVGTPRAPEPAAKMP